MTAQPKVSRPWEMVSTDLMGPLPRSLKGNECILVVTDYFSKYYLVFPMRTSTAEMVTRRIGEEVILVYGAPRLLLCDNGPQYRSHQFRKLAKKYDCEIRYNANYHPLPNPTERVNRTLKSMPAMYVSDNHRTWDVSIPQISCALRTAKHEATNYSPYFINFGRSMVLCGEDFKKSELFDTNEYDPERTRPEGFKKLFTEVRQRLDAAAKRNEKTYNLRRRSEQFWPNQLVWRKNFVHSDEVKFYAKIGTKVCGTILYKEKNFAMYLRTKRQRWEL
ncbi:hypothetical protein JTB14_001183 [Gonioctena quinquepunctata]|nr:hypothetical protein JTB14_001183 [Gonioctena quinquepunctata]